MTSDQVDLVTADAGLRTQRLHRLNIQLPQQEIDPAKIGSTGAFSAGKPKDFLTYLRGKGLEHKAQLLNFRLNTVPGDAAQRRIHAVGGGAGHQAHHQTAGFFHT